MSKGYGYGYEDDGNEEDLLITHTSLPQYHDDRSKATKCKDFMGRFFRREHSLIEEDGPQRDLEEDPEVRAERIKNITGWIRTGCLLIIAIVALGVGLIYLQFVLVPLVLARFFVYLFQPFINYMVGKKSVGKLRCKLPRAVAVFICCIVVTIFVALIVLALYYSIVSILNDYDAYVSRFHELYNDVLQLLVDNGFTQEQIDQLMPEFNFGDLIPIIAAELEELIPQSTLFLLFLIYMLLEYNEKEEKLDVQRTIDSKIRKYIILKVLISLSVGICVCIALAILQVDMWILFGLLTFLLNFIPNVGSIIATILPLPVAILDPEQTWWSIVLVVAVPISIHLFIGNLVEPNLMGHSMSISPVAVLVALAFWSGVWGVVGAFMSVPLTVMLNVWLLSIDHPMAIFLGNVIGGHIHVTEVVKADDEATKERLEKQV